jgi:GR25 family glycosyltransferase involved in LPS biosynthesis
MENALPADTQDMFTTKLNTYEKECFFSHRTAWKRVSDTCPPDSFALIFEDDENDITHMLSRK